MYTCMYNIYIYIIFFQFLRVIEDFLAYVVLYNYVIPISLYVTIGTYYDPFISYS